MNIIVNEEYNKFSIQTSINFIYLHSQNNYEDYTSRKTRVSSPQAKKQSGHDVNEKNKTKQKQANTLRHDKLNLV